MHIAKRERTRASWFMLRFFGGRCALVGVFFAAVLQAASADTKWPMIIATPNGAVILPTEREKKSYDDLHYAAARRVDNMLYISGVIVGRREDEGRDSAAFKIQARRTLERLKVILEASGASFQDVVMINSFHVWQGPNFSGTRDEQFAAFEEVVGEFIKAPYPAWTAVGTTGLLADSGIVEVQVIARIPNAKSKR